MQRWIGSLAVVTLASCVACSTNYRPRPSPRLAMVIEDGAPALEKNGQVEKVGPFGGGLVDSVQGVPTAEDYADTYRSRTIAGFVVGIIGAPVAGVGTGLFIANENDEPPSDGLRAASLGMLFGGLALAITGSILTASAQPYFWDAINAYNDAVPGYGPMPPPGVWAPPPGAPGAPPPAAPPAAPPPAAPPPAAPPATPGPASE